MKNCQLSNIKYLLKVFILIFIYQLSTINYHLYAEKYKYDQKYSQPHKIMAAACAPATGKTDLNINNVRARINTGGDMWWDLQGNPEYEIPKGSKKTAMFSAALWIGGLDVNGQLKLAAQRYRQVGIDFWTGPLTITGEASITSDVCKQYDKHWVITRGEVEQFKAWYANPAKYPNYTVPKSITDWKYCANGDVSLGQCYYLAPYVSADGSGDAYNPDNGDYPFYDFGNTLCKKQIATPGCTAGDLNGGNGILADQVLKGDQTIWWVFNDKGNIHTETGGAAIGLEIHAQAFAFTTNDEINNMTFYSYEIINRSTFRLTQTYFSQWVDSDIGYAWDDYVGCDVLRGLGYTYNGKDVDGSGQPQAYGAHPPAVGVDFFQGPYMDQDGLDNPKFDPKKPNENCNEAVNGVNFGDGIIDNERFGMRRFVYHNNSSGVQGDPTIAIHYYQYLKGIWKDGTKMLYGGNAHYTSGAYGPECDFMFPGDSDPCNWGTAGKNPNGPKYWTEETANNVPYDRRFMESAGPFTLEPGAINYITVGVPWARSFVGGPFQSVELLRTVDDKCQRLFDNCFKVLDGPDAPDLVVQELNKELVLYITNNKLSNNYNEKYQEWDPSIITPDSLVTKYNIRFDSLYRFEGYQIYQLKDATVSVTDVLNPDLARLVAQCDIKNYRKTYNLTTKTWVDNTSDPIDKLVNYTFDQNSGGNIPTVEVTGADSGIVHTFHVTLDQFATGDKHLVNNKQYYYIAVAYGYNEFMKYSQDPASFVSPTQTSHGIGLEGQKKPYLGGRKSAGGQPISYVVAIPHINSPEFSGVLANAQYGQGPKITRVEGQGNGGNILELTDETINKIISAPPYKLNNIEYVNGKGPINVKVIDPLTVVKANYTIKFDSVSKFGINNCYWSLINNDNGKVYHSDRSIAVGNEQVFLDLGLSINIQQVNDPGSNSILDLNGYLNPSARDKNFKEVEYQDSSRVWLSGVPNSDVNSPWHWIRSGTLVDPNNPKNNSYDYTGVGTGTGLDDNQYYEKVISGLWAPYRLCSKYTVFDGSSTGYGPAWKDPNDLVFGNASSAFANKLSNIASVDLVMTPDQTKWTRCCVVETSDDSQLAEGNADKFSLRKHPSVGKDGLPDNSGTNGMSWFPGYAINLETGERLNIMFGENSWLVGENGRDLIFNPTPYFRTPMGDLLWGGMHYVYVMGHNDADATRVPAYDEGQWIYNKLKSGQNLDKIYVYRDAMWAGIPMKVYGEDWLSNQVILRFRVNKRYKQFSNASNEGAANPQNNNYPVYTFSTGDMFTEKSDIPLAKSALDLINVVPNPYYSYGGYETNQIDTRVRITNLPEKCTVTIYTLSGGIIRQYKVDKTVISSLKSFGDTDYKTSIDWDLKNHAGIPISSGLYIIHINAYGLGEKVIKWFGTIRPTDVTGF